MTLSPTVYFGAWTTALLIWATLSYKYYEKWEKQPAKVGDKIRRVNAQSGYNQSVGREDLVKQLRIPWKRNELERFAENNGVGVSEYITEIHRKVGHPEYLFFVLVFHGMGFVFALSGISYLAPGGVLSAEIYLLLVYGLFVVSFGLYWRF